MSDASTSTAGPDAGALDAPKLGTFLGVFTPSILTILGVILFLRLGWVVGNLGLLKSLAVVAIANAITLATALSVSAVATNMHVGAGGAYYIISRSLGLEIGGAIGLPLFLAQTFSVTLYAFGLAESLQLLWPHLPQRPVALATVIVVSLLAARSADLALKLQLPILAAITLALLSLGVGAFGQARDAIPLWQGASGGASFWEVFAVFFPAVTGIMAGISLSGDLAEPKKSIPRGTLAAVLVGAAVYLGVPILLAIAATPAELVANNLIWFQIALVSWVIFPGLWGAIFSSAVGSALGAPRTLEALADDSVVVPRTVAMKASPKGRRAVAFALSTCVALLAVGLGDLNAVAPVLTMFFLTTYGMVNLVAGLEQLSGAPSYRPTIRVPWWISLGGAAGCLGVMWLINRWAAVIAVVLEILVYLALRRRSLHASWGDLRYGALMSLTRATALQLRDLPVDPRNWRPHILVFAGDLEKRIDLVRIAAWLNQDRGILTVCRLVVGEVEELGPDVDEEVAAMNVLLRENDLTAFAELDVVSDYESGVGTVAQANGIAGIASNTLMFGWTEKADRLASNLKLVRRFSALGKSTVVCRIAPRRWSSRMRRIDVWWGGLEHNGDMLLLFAHLLSLNTEWSEARVCVKTIASPALDEDAIQGSLDELLQRSRIAADTEVLRRPEGGTVREMIQRESAHADLVFMGLREPGPGEETAYAQRLAELVEGLPTVVLVRAAGPFAGQLL